MLENPGEILKYSASGDYTLEYRRCGEDSADDAVVYINGLESHGEWFADIAQHLCQNGLAVYLWDRRGSGLNEADRGDCKSYSQFVDDLAIFLEEKRTAHKHIHLVGHSWGGKFAAYFAIRRPFLCDSLTLITPGLAPRVGYSLPKKVGAAYSAIRKKHRRYPTPVKTEMFTDNPEALDYIRQDRLRLREITASFLFENLKMDSFLKENSDGLRIPAALYLAGRDEVIDNALVREKFSRFRPHRTHIREWKDAKHCLLFEKPDELKQDILEWLGGCLSPEITPRKILIAGAGSVGCTIGGFLAMSGHDVTLLARARHVESIRADGLKMNIYGSEKRVKNIAAVPDTKDIGKQDVIIVCVKSFDTEALIGQIRPNVSPDTVILSVQNGIGNEELLQAAFPRNPIAGGVVLGYFAMLGAGRCETRSDRGGILIGASANMDPAALESLAEILRDSRMIVRTQTDCRGVKWSKLLLNASFNALSAVTDLPAEELLGDKNLFALNRRLFRECLAVMRRSGIPVYDLPGYPVKKLARASVLPSFIARPLRKLGGSEQGGRSSMWYDITSGRGKTEIDFLNGVIVRQGAQSGIPTPASAHVADIVREITGNEEARKKYAQNPNLVCRVPGNK